MKFIIFASLLALAIAQRGGYERARAPSVRDDSQEFVKLLRDDRHHGDDGSFSVDFASEDGISISKSGSRLDHVEENPVGHQGTVKFTFPTGEDFELKYVANENGYQPESSWLPVAPEFPHPIPQFVLDQIEKAAREDAEQERSAAPSAPRSRYAAPDSEEK